MVDVQKSISRPGWPCSNSLIRRKSVGRETVRPTSSQASPISRESAPVRNDVSLVLLSVFR